MNDLMSEMSSSGVKLINQKVKGLMYAVNVTLVAGSEADLQICWIPSLVIVTNGACVWCLVVVGLMLHCRCSVHIQRA